MKAPRSSRSSSTGRTSCPGTPPSSTRSARLSPSGARRPARSSAPHCARPIPGSSSCWSRRDAVITTVLAAGGSAASDASRRRRLGRGRAGQPGRAGAAGPVPDQLARAVGGLQRRAVPDRRRHAGRHPRVRRPPDHRAVLVQGGGRGRHPAVRRRPRARRPPGRDRGPAGPPGAAPRTADKRVAVMLSSYPTRHSRVGNAVGLDTPASAVALLRAMREAGYDLGDGFPEDGDDADPRADRRGRPRHRVADRRPAPRRPGPGPAHRVPPFLR